jgi:hypothetical protein
LEIGLEIEGEIGVVDRMADSELQRKFQKKQEGQKGIHGTLSLTSIMVFKTSAILLSVYRIYRVIVDVGKPFNPSVEFPEFSRKEIKDFEKKFKEFDTSKDGWIDEMELKYMMEKLGIALYLEPIPFMLSIDILH